MIYTIRKFFLNYEYTTLCTGYLAQNEVPLLLSERKGKAKQHTSYPTST